jgi:hypothetical protein
VPLAKHVVSIKAAANAHLKYTINLFFTKLFFLHPKNRMLKKMRKDGDCKVEKELGEAGQLFSRRRASD